MGAALAAIGIGAGALGSIMQSKAAIAAGEDQSKASQLNAFELEDFGINESERIRREGRRALASQQLAYAKAGVTLDGSPLELLAQNAAEIEVEALNARRRAFRAASLQRAEGESAFKAAKTKAAATLIGGLGGAVGSGVSVFGTPSMKTAKP